MLHLLHLNFYLCICEFFIFFFIILLCRTEFDGYCEGELIKVFSLSVAVSVCACT